MDQLGIVESGAGMSLPTVRVSVVALALYRTYRPGSLAEVIGQGHVTEPLARALKAGRIHHAYLFSGPRGCGKTSTARILARSLNCEQGPTAAPCGTCRSCVELAPNGPGSIDVVELDAATHRGIDDARELREKAIYAPAASRYKIYIIDEAHQLTNEAANALLKLVEEPPPHLRFIFATTEPDKIIPTIRSRTFHYGFRLVPARTLADHLGSVCQSEGVPAQAPALAVVARAGAGSVRDSLSVLGQLLAGAGPEGLTYVEAIASLGLTDTALIDDFVAALAAGSAADMFGIVDQVITAGHDPRRFVIDTLDRLRDLIMLRVDHEARAKGLVDAPDDAGERMLAQSQSLGLAELSRAADLVSEGLGQIKGATAPRLQLELLCARLALPDVTSDLGGVLARLERLERGGVGGVSGGSAAAGALAASAAVSGSGTTSGRRSEPGGDPASPGPSSPGTLSPGTLSSGTLSSPPVSAQELGSSRPVPPRRPQLRSSGTGQAGSAPDHTAPAPPPAVPATPPPRPEESAESRARTAAGHQPAVPAPETAALPTALAHVPAPAQAASPGAQAGLTDADGVQVAADGPATSAGRAATDDLTAVPTATADQPPAAAPASAAASGPPSGLDQLARVREAWPSVLDRLAQASRVAWTAFHGATPVTCTEGALAVAVAEPGTVRAIAARGHDERLRQALIDVLGLDVSIDVLHDPQVAGLAVLPGGSPGSGRGSAPSSTQPDHSGSPASGSGTSASGPSSASEPAATAGPGAGSATSSLRPADVVRAAGSGGPRPEAAPDEASADDPDLDASGAQGLALIARELGARPIGEIDHS